MSDASEVLISLIDTAICAPAPLGPAATDALQRLFGLEARGRGGCGGPRPGRVQEMAAHCVWHAMHDTSADEPDACPERPPAHPPAAMYRACAGAGERGVHVVPARHAPQPLHPVLLHDAGGWVLIVWRAGAWVD